MTSKEFILHYWNQYLLLEKEYRETLPYVNLCVENRETFSDVYLKLLLQIGSEIDIAFKEYCGSLDSDFVGKTIGSYRECIQRNKATFILQEVKESINGNVIQPWKEWQSIKAPFWWTAYNKAKHERYSVAEIDGIQKHGFQFANQKYTIEALAGLFQILIYFYYDIAWEEEKKVVTPIPGSKLFTLVGGAWDSVDFFTDCAFYIDERGYLIYEYSQFPYH